VNLTLTLPALGRLDEAQGHWLLALTIFEELPAAGADQIARPCSLRVPLAGLPCTGDPAGDTKTKPGS
jgi:hypothetical protein